MEPLLFWNTEHLVTPVLKLAHPGSSSTFPDFREPPTFLEHGTSRYTRVKAGTPWIIQYLTGFQGTPTFLEHGTSRYTRVKAGTPWIIQYLQGFQRTPYFSGTRNISLHQW